MGLLQNGFITKQVYYKMGLLQNRCITKWVYYKTGSLQNGYITKWVNYKTGLLQIRFITKCVEVNESQVFRVNKILTFMVESEAHVHECFGRYKVFSFITFKQHHSKVLHQSEEY